MKEIVKRLKKICVIIIALALIMSSVIGCGNDDDDDTAKIKIGTNRALGTITPLLAEKLGYFTDSEIEFEIVEFSDGTSLMEAMAAGELDMAFCGIVPVATWVSRGSEIKVVAAANGGGHVILSKESTGINTISDLKEHSLATPSIGTVTDVILRSYLLAEADVNPDDIQIIPGMSPADMATSLEVSGEVDAILTWEPFASQAEKMYDDITIIADATEIWKENTGSNQTYPVNVVCATEDFINNHKEDLKNILAALEKTVDYINGDTHDDAVKKMAEILGVDEDVVENACKRTEFTYKLDLDSMYVILNWAYELGYINEVPEESQMIYNVN